MGELDEKEATQTGAQASNASAIEVISVEEPKETETLLTPDAKSESNSVGTEQNATPVVADIESPKSASSITVTIEKEPESEAGDVKEQLLRDADADANIVAKGEAAAADASEVPSPVTQEGREVKPKKIPIGGIKMPGFFTKSKPKASTVEGDGADGELLEKNADAENDNGKATAAELKAAEAGDDKPTDKPARRGFFDVLRLRNPFAKRPVVKNDEDEITEIKIDEAKAPEQKNSSDTADASVAPKKCLLNAIRLPIANMTKKLRPVNGESAADAEDVELGTASTGSNGSGSGPHNKAGLASMETLDDSLKDIDGKDVTDRAATIKADDLEAVMLGDNADKSKKHDEAIGGAKPTLVQSIRAYKCSVDDLAIAGGLIIFVLLVAVICCFTFTGYGTIQSAPVRDGKFVVAHISCGQAEGQVEDSAFAFRGIPYAQSPTGERRFRPASALDSIDSCWNGTLKAYASGPLCPQRLSNGSIVGDEDCLRLDVVTPHIRYDNPLPVVVLFGAESFVGGSPNILRPSARFARSKDVVFVRPAFRLGVAGFLALDALAKDVHPPTSGNYALSDMLAALQWIQQNIAHFGGDPKAVTLFGHRTGATLVSALASSASAHGLFARAWVSSGATKFPGGPLADAQRANLRFASDAQCETAECLRALSAEQLVRLTPEAWTSGLIDLPGRDEANGKLHEWLVLDGQILKQHPSKFWMDEQPGPPRMVIGTTKHTAHSDRLRGLHANWTEDVVRQHVENSLIGAKNLTEQALDLYGATYAGLVAMISDIRTICPLLTISRVQKAAPFYVVSQLNNDAEPLASMDDDVQAILGRYEPKTFEQRRYVAAMQELFYRYVSLGLVPQFNEMRRVLDVGQDTLSKEDYPNCNFWINADVVPRHERVD